MKMCVYVKGVSEFIRELACVFLSCACTQVILFDEGTEYKRVCLCVCNGLYVAIVFSSLYFPSQWCCLAAA